MTLFSFFFFNDTATTEIYTLSLHDALPISFWPHEVPALCNIRRTRPCLRKCSGRNGAPSANPHLERERNLRRLAIYRSEEHTSELQSQSNLVCRLLLEKKNNERNDITTEL